MLLVTNTLELFATTAPWLILGLLLAGFMKVLLPESLVKRWIGGRGLWPVVKASFLGAPLPLCSCGVVPVAMEMRRNGASKGSSIAFMLSTPENGIDSISLSYVLLGPFMAVVRPIAGISLGILAGIMTGWGEDDERKVDGEARKHIEACCHNHNHATETSNNVNWQNIRAGLTYAFSDMLDDIKLWLVIGIVAAGLVITFLPAAFLTQWGSGPIAMLVMIIIGVPMYICASASTPLAVSLLAVGLSPGTVLVFLLAGPATNIGTLGIITQEFGRRALIAYLFSIVCGGILMGMGVDLLVNIFSLDTGMGHSDHSHTQLYWYHYACSILLLLAAIKPFRNRILLFVNPSY